MAFNKHNIYGVEVGSTLLGGITQGSLNTGTTVRGEPRSGQLYPEQQHIVSQAPTASFTSEALAAAINAIGLLGKDISALTGGLSFYGQKHADGGTRLTGAAHRKYNLVSGILVLEGLSADSGGDASLSCNATVDYDGVNNPIIETDNAALPGGLADNERFALGKVTIENVVLTQKLSVQINFGLNVVAESADADVWPTHTSIVSVQPSLTIRSSNLELFAESGGVPLSGLNGTHANTAIYFRKRADGGTFVADATAVHVKFTAAGLLFVETPLEGGDRGEITFTMPLKFDGTNTPLTVNTASAIV